MLLSVVERDSFTPCIDCAVAKKATARVEQDGRRAVAATEQCAGVARVGHHQPALQNKSIRVKHGSVAGLLQHSLSFKQLLAYRTSSPLRFGLEAMHSNPRQAIC